MIIKLKKKQQHCTTVGRKRETNNALLILSSVFCGLIRLPGSPLYVILGHLLK